jgi:K+-sensing histidine kinase KdpD
VVFVVRFVLHPFLGEYLPTSFFTVYAVILACYYGFWVACLNVVLSIPIVMYFFLKPYDSFDVEFTPEVSHQIAYFAITILLMVLMEKFRRERYRLELLNRVSNTRFKLMLEYDADQRRLLSEIKSQT